MGAARPPVVRPLGAGDLVVPALPGPGGDPLGPLDPPGPGLPGEPLGPLDPCPQPGRRRVPRPRHAGRPAGRDGAASGHVDQVRTLFVPPDGLPLLSRHGSAACSIAHQLITVSLVAAVRDSSPGA